MTNCPIQCGYCCRDNGLIPPLLPDEEAPDWLWRLVHAARGLFGWQASAYDCMYLQDNRCLIYDVRPELCRDFLCPSSMETLWTAEMDANCKYKPGDRVLIQNQSGEWTTGTVSAPAEDDDDGDWLVASDKHRHLVARHEREMQPISEAM